MEWWIVFLGGGAMAAIIGLVERVIITRMNINGNDIKACRMTHDDLAATIRKLIAVQRTVLSDRIMYLGGSYLRKGSISLEERRVLVDMHDKYSDYLDGNGNLDALMRDVMELPLDDVREERSI